MVLATIIRLEMAYPGVGILAGDSLQYLSVVTAHAVIMVFFMIMPLLFGAFGNFLLPTQLGVHDVAFPRLNSVAFWFLPGGLIMLCQLVCLDRRYQRMNCFNIREIQTLLKARFYADLLHESSRHLFLSKTTINLRFKLQDLNFLNLNSLLINRYGVYTGLTNKTQTYNLTSKGLYSFQNQIIYGGDQSINYLPKSSWYFLALKVINGEDHFANFFLTIQDTSRFFFTIWAQQVTFYCKTIFSFFEQPLPTNFLISNFFKTHLLQLHLAIKVLFSELNWFYTINNFFVLPNFSSFFPYYTHMTLKSTNPTILTYVTNGFSFDSLQTSYTLTHQEDSSEYRYQRLQNPIFRYDFKLGNYMPDENKKKSPFLYTTIHDLTTGVRKSPWFYSADFFKFVKGDLSSYFLFHNDFMSKPSLTKIFNNNLNEISSSHAVNDPFYMNLTHSAGLYNYFFLLSEPSQFLNNRWLSVNTLNQKFYKMFLTNSMQQRIHAN